MKKQYKKEILMVFKSLLILGLLSGFTGLMSSIPKAGAQIDPVWPCWRHDQEHTGRSSIMGPQAYGLKWTYPSGPATGHDITTSPAVGLDGTIYFGSSYGYLYAIDPDGEINENWPVELRHRKSDPNYIVPIFHSSPAIDPNGVIYIGSSDGNIYAIYPDGQQKWRLYPPPPEEPWDASAQGIWSSPVIHNGILYIGSYDGKLYAVNTEIKDVIWETADPNWGTFSSSPAIGTDGTIYIGSNDCHVYAFDPNGQLKEGFPLDTNAPVASSPAIDKNTGTIYVGSNDHCVYAIRPYGVQQWATPFCTEGPVYSSPAVGDDGTIYVGSYDHCVYAINPDGTEKWRYETGAGVVSSPAIGSDGTVYVGSNDGNLYAFDPNNGNVKWMSDPNEMIIDPNDIEGGFSSSPAIGSDGIIYIGNLNGRLYAFGSDDVQWCYSDTDSDGYGDPNHHAIQGYPCPEGYVRDNTDCNDQDSNINPSAIELCDNKDNDCNDNIDEDLMRDCNTVCGHGTETCENGQWVNCTASLPPCCNAIRSASGYAPGYPVTIEIEVNPNAQTANYAVEETPPAGWLVDLASINEGGSWETVNKKVKWGLFDDSNQRTLTYIVTAPSGATGCYPIYGIASFDGINQSICGDVEICEGLLHPADMNGDWQLIINELTGYGAAWKKGEVWPVPPNPILIEYVTRAGYIWKLGETYHYIPEQSPPLCWDLATTQPAARKREILEALNLNHSFDPNSYMPGQPVNVSIEITPDTSTQVYAVEDMPPEGWSVDPNSINKAGGWDPANKKVKWGPFFDYTPRTFAYNITPSPDESGIKGFHGVYSADGINYNIDRVIPRAPYDEDIEFEMNLSAGWSLISLPVTPLDATLSALFPGAAAMYGFERGTGYVRVKRNDELQIGSGYWILVHEDKNYVLTGQPIPSYSKTVNSPGWEMIGGCTSGARPTAGGCNIGVIYRYVRGAGYVQVLDSEKMDPGRGFWILLNEVADQCQLTVEPTAP